MALGAAECTTTIDGVHTLMKTTSASPRERHTILRIPYAFHLIERSAEMLGKGDGRIVTAYITMHRMQQGGEERGDEERGGSGWAAV
jgi:hypothetical protein